jgi:hypothetical protein
MEQMTIRARREALTTMPTELGDAFHCTMRRIESQSSSKKQQALSTLKWVFLSQRQLTVDELRFALSIRTGDTRMDED